MTDVTATQRTNWAGNLTYRAAALERPSSVAAVQELVASTPRLTALGSTHSFNDIADTEAVQVTLTDLPPVLEIDTARRVVRVAAGMTHAQVAAGLEARGWALGNLASLPHISTAGAVATGTHGSGVRNPSLAQAVVGLDVVRADGSLVQVASDGSGSGSGTGSGSGSGSAGDLDAHRVALGALGVVTAVELAIEPSFQVATTVHLDLPWDAVLEHFDAVMADAYSVSMFTAFDDRGARQVWTKHRVDEPAPSIDLVALGARRATGPVHPGENDTAGVTEQGGVPGPWSERLPHFRSSFSPSTGAEIQAEYLVPAASAVAAIQALLPLHDLFAPILIAAEFRTVAPDTAWLAPSSERQSVGLHFTFRRDVSAVAAAVEQIEDVLAPFDPGRTGGRSPRRHVPLHEAYPHLGRSLPSLASSTRRGASATRSWSACWPEARSGRAAAATRPPVSLASAVQVVQEPSDGHEQARDPQPRDLTPGPALVVVGHRVPPGVVTGGHEEQSARGVEPSELSYTDSRVFDSGKCVFPWLSTRRANRSPELLSQFRASLVRPGTAFRWWRSPVDQPTDTDVLVGLPADRDVFRGRCTAGMLRAHMCGRKGRSMANLSRFIGMASKVISKQMQQRGQGNTAAGHGQSSQGGNDWRDMVRTAADKLTGDDRSQQQRPPQQHGQQQQPPQQHGQQQHGQPQRGRSAAARGR